MYMDIKLFDSELNIMEILWEDGDTSAKELALILNKKVGWIKTTTYTIIKKCIQKGVIQRIDPGFICHALIDKKDVQQYETNALISKLYDSAPDQLIASLLSQQKISPEKIEKLMKMIEKTD